MKIFLGKNPITDFSFEREILAKGSNEIILLISHWIENYLILGYGQNFEGLNKNEIAQNNITVFRRPSGGTAVLSTDSINISLFIPSSNFFAKPIEELYKNFLVAVKSALSKIGKDVEMSNLKEKVNSPICFLSQSGETLLYQKKKFFGGAQARNKRILLVHGTLLLNFEPDIYSRVFGVEKEILRQKIVSIKLNPEQFIESTIGAFKKTLHEWSVDSPEIVSPSEQFLKETKTEKWMPIFKPSF
ncbi:MAG: hypothetical protein N2445_06435 [Acidobacteria bacterium]|nr:hypothetical protein [Acidobacteriota bacterium]